MDAIQPYREADVTPLEALVRRGPSDAVTRRIRVRQSHVGMSILGFYLAAQIIAALPPTLGVGAMLPTIFLAWLLWRGRRSPHQELGAVMDGLPIPVESFEVWPRRPGSAVVVDLVLAAPSAIAVRAVQTAAPTARVAPGDGCIHVAWALDVDERSLHLAHLLTELMPHRHELGLTRLRFAHRPRPRPALTATSSPPAPPSRPPP